MHIAKCKMTHVLLQHHMFKTGNVSTNNINYSSAVQSHVQDKLVAANKSKINKWTIQR